MKKPIKRVHIKTAICDQELDLYGFHYRDNDKVALELWSPETEEEPAEPYYTATVNVQGAFVPEGHVLLKGWSENEGLPEALVAAGLVEMTGVTVPTGYCEAQEAKLLFKVPEGDPDE